VVVCLRERSCVLVMACVISRAAGLASNCGRCLMLRGPFLRVGDESATNKAFFQQPLILNLRLTPTTHLHELAMNCLVRC
jgi:hypothetical protein